MRTSYTTRCAPSAERKCYEYHSAVRRLRQALWPLSNDIRSKQFIKIFKTDDGYESMVQRVYRQIKEVDADASVTIATSKTQVSSIHNQLGNSVGVCVEPCRRDTFPAIALATAFLHDVKGVGSMRLWSSARWIRMSTTTILPR